MRCNRQYLIFAVATFLMVSPPSSLAQNLPGRAEDDERIWFQWNVQGMLEPDETSYRGGRLSFHMEGLLEPLVYDDTSLIGFIGDELPFILNVETCNRIDENDGSTVLTYACRTNPAASTTIKLLFNLDNGYSELNFNAFDLGVCVTSGPNIERTESEMNFEQWFSSSIEVPDSFTISFTREDLQRDFEKSYTYDLQYATFFECPLGGQGRIVIRSEPPDETKVTLEGCADLLIGIDAQITANAKPSGGTYHWQSEPASLFNISGSEQTVTITGSSAGRGAISVEYTPKRGKKAKTTLSGSVVELLSINGGPQIPPIGIYDENGVEKSAVVIPIVQDPPARDLLSFSVADPSIATVDDLGTGLLIQGLQEGQTTAQAQDRCGHKDEQIITIEVVPCDQETIKKLRDQLKELQSKLDENKKRFNDRRNDPEFSRTMHEIDRHLTTAAVKGLGIGAAIAGGAAGEAPGALDYVLEVLSHIRDVTEEGTWSGRWNVQDMIIKHYTTMGKRLTLGIINDLIEFGEAYSEAREGIEILDRIVKELQKIREEGDEIRKEYNKIDLRLIDLCKDYGIERPEPPPAEPPPAEPPPTEPPPAEPGTPPRPPQPPPPTEPTEPPPTEPGEGEQPPGEPPGDDDIIIEPPPPPPPPPSAGPGGFPVDCGCERWDQSGWAQTTEGLGRIRQDVAAMVPCLDEFMENSSRPVEATADSTNRLFESMEQALWLPEEQKVETFRGFLPLLDELKNKYTRFGGEFMSVSDSLGQCNQAIEQAGELIRGGGSQ